MIIKLLVKILGYNVTEEQALWVQEQIQVIGDNDGKSHLSLSFAKASLIIGQRLIKISKEDEYLLNESIPFLRVDQWPADMLSRALLLKALPNFNKDCYLLAINELLEWTDMNELAAFYAALPFLSYPNEWKLKVLEGIRSNVSTVLNAILYNNPYTADNLEQAEWNQMICKAIFTGKDIDKIVKIDERANIALAQMLLDYVYERHSAHRPVPGQVWRLIDPFINELSPHHPEEIYSRLKVEGNLLLV